MELSEVKQYLKKGDQSKIAKMANVSRSTVYHTLNGKFENSLVLKCAGTIAEERKKEMNTAISELRSELGGRI